MCILFLYTDENPKPGNYKVVLAANRDEFYQRPTEPAQFWGTDPDTVGGRDKVSGREGGTWLAMNCAGKIGALLNIMTPTQENSQDKVGRGFLVNGFLSSENADGLEYTRTLQRNAEIYNSFNFVTIQITENDGIQIMHYSNKSPKPPVQLSSNRVHGFGNSLYAIPFQKVKEGENIFESIIAKYGTDNQKSALVEKLIGLLRSEKQYENDAQVIVQAPLTYNNEEVKALTSNYIYIPSKGFGSRTHTIITVNHANEVEYHEWTMKEPINPALPKWNKTNFQFKLKLRNQRKLLKSKL